MKLTGEGLATALGPEGASSFADWPDPTVPMGGAGVYTIWDGAGRFLHAGIAIAGEGKGGLRLCLAAHASGRRLADDVCIQLADRLLLPTLTQEEIRAIAAAQQSMDALLRDFIRRELRYRWAACSTVAEARAAAAMLRAGDWPHGMPLLKPQGADPLAQEAKGTPARGSLPRRRPIRL